MELSHSAAITTVSLMHDAGLVLAVDGAVASNEEAIAAAAQHGTVNLYLGINGRTTKGLFPLALELPATKSENGEAILSAVERLGCAKLFERLGKGWTSTAEDGSQIVYLGISAATKDDFEVFIRTLPAWASFKDGQPFARLSFAKGIAVGVPGDAETTGHVTELTTITPSELAGIGAVLDEASDQRDQRARSWYNVREHDPATNRIRDAYNRSTSEWEVMNDLSRLGWSLTEEVSPAINRYRCDGMEAELVLASRTLVLRRDAAASLRDGAEVLRHFDLLARFDPRFASKVTAPEELALWLLNEGLVSPERGVLIARERPLVEPNQAYPDLVDAFGSAIGQARSRIDPRLPLAFGKTAGGQWDGIVSITPHGEVFRWDNRTIQNLVLASAQPARVTKDRETGEEKIAYKNAVDPQVALGLAHELQQPGALAPLEIVTTQPLLADSGEIYGEPGYHRAAKAFVAIPHRERSAWKRDFNPKVNPTRDDVQAAFEWLSTEITSDMPFQSEIDRARYFAYLFTCVFRYMVNGSIGFAANAADRGVGKSLGLLIGRLIGQGHPGYGAFRVGRWADEETEKQLGTLLRSGGRHFHCDEVPRNEVATGLVLTEGPTSIDGEREVRILGASDNLRQTGIIVSLAGCAIDLGGDLNRRFLMFTLEWRQGGLAINRSGFRHENLASWVVQNRPAILAHMYTIMSYFLQHGPAHPIPSMGFNHNWAAKILGALSNVDGPTGKSLAQEALDGWIDEVNAQDSLGDEWAPVMVELWRALAAEERFTMDDVRKVIVAAHARSDRPQLPAKLQGLVTNPDSTNIAWSKALKEVLGTTIPDVDSGCGFRLRPTERNSKSKKSATYTISGFDKNLRDLDPRLALPRDGGEQTLYEPEWAPIVTHLAQHPEARQGIRAARAQALVNSAHLAVPPRLGGADQVDWERQMTATADGVAFEYAGESVTLSSEVRADGHRYFIARPATEIAA